MRIQKTFRYCLSPSAEQEKQFRRFAGSTRFVFNWALAARKAIYEQTGRIPKYYDQSKQLTRLKGQEETGWLKETTAQVLQQALLDLHRAYEAYFSQNRHGQKVALPGFRRKGKHDAFRFPQRVKACAGRVYFPKIGWVRYRDSRPIFGRITQTTVKREGEHWYVGFISEIDIEEVNTPQKVLPQIVGLDVGLKQFVVLSHGEAVPNPQFLQRVLPKLRAAQRRLRKKTKGSNNWKRQVRKVTQLHLKVKNCRWENPLL